MRAARTLPPLLSLILAGCQAGLGAPAGGEPREPSPPRAAVVVIIGATGSDVDERNVQLDHLAQVVVPRAEADRSRVMVGVLSDASLTRPAVIADLSFDLKSESRGNPVVEQELRGPRVDELRQKVSNALGHLQPSPASDPFGAVTWAESVFAQFPPAIPKLLVLLTDAVATMPGCNLTGRDLRPEYHQSLIADCASGHVPRLEGVEVWQGGAGLGRDDPVPTAVALGLESLWRAFWTATGAHLSRYGPTLVGPAPTMAGRR